jgi:ABC-type phosphate transport system substrate-binding protein
MSILSSRRRRVVAVTVALTGVLGGTALVAGAVAASSKTPVAYLTTKSGTCKTGYQKVTLHSGSGRKKETVYVCVLQQSGGGGTPTPTPTPTTSSGSQLKAANSTILGGGSNTTYGVIAGLSSVFNALQGCNPIANAGAVQPLDYSCPSGSLNGLAGAQTDNPLNDVAAEGPAIGGSAGVSQLGLQGSDRSSFANGNVAPLDYASTVSGPSSANPQGLNYVAYAEDGISWFHFTSVDGTPTPSAGLTNLTKTDLQGIWNGTITNFNQITDVTGYTGPDAPIRVYTASAGAGIRSSWEKFLGEASGGSSTYIESLGSTYANSHIISQNEDQKILSNGDAADAIFFFSVGKFNVLCGSAGTNSACTDGKSGTTAAIGQINGITPTASTIYGGTFPAIMKLYTVYSNGSNSHIPPASQATLNFISEDGFLCKPDTEVDDITGETVRQEIDTQILNNGFLPLDQATLGSGGVATAPVKQPFSEDTGVTNPAHITSSPYSQYDLSGSNPAGYCTVSTTDTISTTQ